MGKPPSPERDRVLRFIADEVAAVRPRDVARVAVDGVDGAGKTTFADELADALSGCGRPVIRASADDFLNPRDIRYRRGRGSPLGFFLDSYDYPALSEFLLEPLEPAGTRLIRRAAFDHRADQRALADEERVARDAILILDGMFLHRDELHGLWDYSVFLEVAFSESIARCARREGATVSPDPDAPSNRRYVAGQRIYLSRCVPSRRATRVVDNNDLASPRLLP